MENCSSNGRSTRIEIDVSEFKRGEISLKLRRDNSLIVHALHLDQRTPENFFRKELFKTFPLPSDAEFEKIRSVIRQDGVLTIDVPTKAEQSQGFTIFFLVSSKTILRIVLTTIVSLVLAQSFLQIRYPKINRFRVCLSFHDDHE